MIAVQHIVVKWSKASRSGKPATLRNAVPDRFPFADMPESYIDKPLTLVHQHILVDESDMFQYPRQTVTVEEIALQKRVQFGCTFIRLSQDRVTVNFAYSAIHGGAPTRTAHPRQVLTLMPGTWGSVTYNGRFGWGWGNWTYHKTTLHIGYFDSLTEDSFAGTPRRVFTELADLW